MPPAGVFTPPTLHGDFLLLAGGSGITPVLSIAKAALRHGRGAVTLVYANRDERSVIFREALGELARRHPGRLRVIHWLDSVQGPPGQRQIEELVRPWSVAECFICGPGPFMDSAQAALQALGVPRGKLHVERFVSLPDPAPTPATESVIPAKPAAMHSAALTVQLDGETHQLSVRPTKPCWTPCSAPACPLPTPAVPACAAPACARWCRAASRLARTMYLTRPTWHRAGPWPARPVRQAATST